MNPPFVEKIKKLLSKSEDGILYELEARFKLFTDDETVNSQTYNRLVHNLPSTLNKYRLEINNRSDGYSIRKRIDVTDPRQTTTWQSKKQLLVDNNKIDSMGIKISFSEEKDLKKSPKDFKVDIVRNIERYTHEHNKYVTLFFSKVTDDSSSSSRYEFEMELNNDYINKNKAFDEFSKAIEAVFCLIHDTPYIYEKSQYESHFKAFNNSLLLNQLPYMNPSALYKARDLKYRDLTGMAFLNNRIRVTFKTDGYRKAMIIDRDGVWLLYGNSLSLVVSDVASVTSVTILDGELVPFNKQTERGPGEGTFFVVFDALIVNGIDVRSKSHKERISAAKSHQIFRDPYAGLTTILKDFWDFKTSIDFFSLMTKLETKTKKNLPFLEDGYIFVSNNMKYNSGVDNCPPGDRILIKRPDMCKWKELNKLTIDFKIEILKESDESYYVNYLSYDRNDKINRIFPHTVSTTIQKEDVRDLGSLIDGAIYECRYDKEMKAFYPVRQRYDRSTPNALLEALSVWENIQDPIEIEVLMGKTLRLMRKYHNRVKRELYSRIPNNYKFLLDIGVGRGGTIESWRKFDKIVAIEPNYDNIAELIVRLNKSGFSWELITSAESLDVSLTLFKERMTSKPQVLIVATGGENYEFLEEITQRFCGSKVDVVASMFSLTFFWKSEAMLNGLKQTLLRCLKPQGQLVFAVMEGGAVRNIFEPQLQGRAAPATKKIITDDYNMRYSGFSKGDALKIHLKDTIVGGELFSEKESQIEYLAYIEEILKDFDNYFIKRLDAENFMSPESKFLSGLYIAGSADRFNSSKEKITEVSKEETPESVTEEEKDIESEIDVELPPLSKKFIKRENPVEPTIINVKVAAQDISSRLIVPLNEDDSVKKMNDKSLGDYIRIGNLFGPYNGIYDAILKAFYPHYNEAKKEEREKIANNFAREFGDPSIPEISYKLNLNIILVNLSTYDNITLYSRSIIKNQRPYIIMGQLTQNGIHYYEVIAQEEVNKKIPAFRTIFPVTHNLVAVSLSLPRVLISEYESWPIIGFYDSAAIEKYKLTQGIINRSSLLELSEYNLLLDQRTVFRQTDRETRQGIIETLFPKFGTVDENIEEIITNEIINYDSLLEISSSAIIADNDELTNRILINDLDDIASDIENYDLVIAAFNYGTNFYRLLQEIQLSLTHCSKHGSVILRLGDINIDFVVSAIYLFNRMFTSVKIIKPKSSSPLLPTGYYLYASDKIAPKTSLSSISGVFEKIKSTFDEGSGPITLVPRSWIAEDTLFLKNLIYIVDILNNSELRALDLLLSQFKE